jgi:hypothetical protein
MTVLLALVLGSLPATSCRRGDAEVPQPAPTEAGSRPAATDIPSRADPTPQASGAAFASVGGQAAPGAELEKLVPLDLYLPEPVESPTAFPGKFDKHVEPVGRELPPLMVPKDFVNLAKGRPVTSSDPNPIVGAPKLVTDGEKESREGNWIELMPGLQWVQIDLGEPRRLYGVAVWHFFDSKPIVFHDVVVQLSDDPDFKKGVQTIFNNDYDNSSGLGFGQDLEYVDSNRGRLIDAKRITARYVRLYSNGSMDAYVGREREINAYLEVEVWGQAPK